MTGQRRLLHAEWENSFPSIYINLKKNQNFHISLEPLFFQILYAKLNYYLISKHKEPAVNFCIFL